MFSDRTMLSTSKANDVWEGICGGPAETPLSEAAYRLPTYLSEQSAWIQHIPFAFALMAWMQPTTFVELGTHRGDSYLAFCQAAALMRVPTHCTAVDTWQGDRETGYYDEGIFRTLRLHHDSRYAAFSKLLRKTFEAAADDFENGSIDLLHIDGAHDERSVRADVRRWLPKMSSAGVILMHDICLRREGAGVRQVWEELRQDRPFIEFRHGYGLGMVAVGESITPALQQLIDYSRTSPGLVQMHFRALGQRIEMLRALRIVSGQKAVSSDGAAHAFPLFRDLAASQPAPHSRVRRTLRLASVSPLLAKVAPRVPLVGRYFRKL